MNLTSYMQDTIFFNLNTIISIGNCGHSYPQDRLKSLVSKLSVIAEHRLDIIKTEGPYEVTQVAGFCLEYF